MARGVKADDGTEKRGLFKNMFYRALEARVRGLITGGREVVLVGDVSEFFHISFLNWVDINVILHAKVQYMSQTNRSL